MFKFTHFFYTKAESLCIFFYEKIYSTVFITSVSIIVFVALYDLVHNPIPQ